MKFQIFILKNHYDILYKTFMCAKRFRIWLDKVDRNIRVYDRSKYLTLFIPEIYDTIYDRTIYLISPKSGIRYNIDHNIARIRID